MFIWAAIPAYLLAVGSCARAALFVRQAGGPKADLRLWWAVALLFGAMVVDRLLNLEEGALAAMRAAATDYGDYVGRANYQAPLAAAFVLLLASVAVWFVRPVPRRRPRDMARALILARLSSLGMIGLVALRLLSFHATDALIFGGPHINRFLDPGFALAAAASGWLFVRSARVGRPR